MVYRCTYRASRNEQSSAHIEDFTTEISSIGHLLGFSCPSVWRISDARSPPLSLSRARHSSSCDGIAKTCNFWGNSYSDWKCRVPLVPNCLVHLQAKIALLVDILLFLLFQFLLLSSSYHFILHITQSAFTTQFLIS